MATIPTSLPIPSEDPRDLKFNAGKFDEVISSDAHYYTDRFGVQRWTIAGMQYTASQAISQFGYITLDSFEDGATLTLPNQVLRYEATGEYYRWDGVFPPGGKVVAAGSTPATSGGVGTGAWLSVGDAALRQQLASSSTGNGANLVVYKSELSSAIARTIQNKFSEFVSVKDFGAIGDGTAHPLSERYATLSEAQAVYSFVTSLTDSIDWAALQAACLSGADGIYIPADTKLSLNKTCNTPARNFAIIGSGPSSIITGTAHVLIETTKSANAPDGSQYHIKFVNVHFTGTTDDQCYVYLNTLFDLGGHMPHVIEGCTFTHGARRQTSVLMTGITGLRFINSTIFSVSGFSAKTDDTGFGLRVALEADMSSSVMNIHIAGSSIISISRPVWIPPRVNPAGGRCEGVRIENNLMGDGIMGIYIDASIAVSIVGNQVSDYLDAVRLSGCQGFVIADNGEITGYNSAIEIINGLSNYITHNGVISDNSIAAMADNCRLVNMPNLGVMSDISITGNTFKGWTDGTGTTYGVIPNGTAVVNHAIVANNTFRNVMHPVFFGANAEAGNYEDFRIDNNTYNLPVGGAPVAFPERQAQMKRYQVSDTLTQTLTSGVTSITIDVSAHKFREIPVYADCQLATAPTTRLVYSRDISTFTQLVFSVQGTTPTTGTHRLCYTAVGMSVYGY